MTTIPTAIPEVKVFEPRVFGDERGFFLESFNKAVLAGHGIDAEFVQDNHSRSARHVLRGLHYQLRRPQGKLVRVVVGEVLDIAVDIRRHSPTFGQHVAVILSGDNKRITWVPPGFAHGFLVRSESAELLYKTTDYYVPEDERGILWSDAALGIDWQLTADPILSARDRSAPTLAQAEIYP